MAEYLVLARKYRSLTFDEVVGQEPIARTLINAIKSRRIAHAYLFTGTRGVGKTTMARILAKALNCLSTEAATPDPCNKCDACIAIGRGDDIDVIEIDGASNRGIDEIRELRANAIFRPARSRYKIYYIDEVHMLTKDAFNALLKTLEEPPEHVKFILSTTEAEKVLPTIVSRTQRFDFRNIPTQLIADHLMAICKKEKVKAEKDALFRIARAAAGSMRDALSLLDQLLTGGQTVGDCDVVRILGTPPDEHVLAIVQAIAAGQGGKALSDLAGLLESGVTLPSTTAALTDAFRNMMIAVTCAPDSELIELPEAQKKALGELAGQFSLPVLVQALGICQRLSQSIRGSSVARALVEAAVVRLAEAEKFVDPASLIERIEALTGAGGQKKNLAVSSTSVARNQTSGSGEAAIQWQESWLKANWSVVVTKLFAVRQSQAAGCLRAVEVIGFEEDLLTLGFDSGHDGVRQRCVNSLGDTIEAALTQLAHRPIRCEYVSTGPDPSGKGGVYRGSSSLSTEEKRRVRNDPAVREALSLFGGEVIDIRKSPPPRTEQEPPEQNDDPD